MRELSPVTFASIPGTELVGIRADTFGTGGLTCADHADAAEAALKSAKAFRLAGDHRSAALAATSARLHAHLAFATSDDKSVDDMDAVARAANAAAQAEDIGQGDGRSWRTPPSRAMVDQAAGTLARLEAQRRRTARP